MRAPLRPCPPERLSVSPFELFRREITIKGSYAEMTSFAAAIAALRTGRVHTDKIISHRFSLDDNGNALETLTSDPTAHKVVIVVAGRRKAPNAPEMIGSAKVLPRHRRLGSELNALV